MNCVRIWRVDNTTKPPTDNYFTSNGDGYGFVASKARLCNPKGGGSNTSVLPYYYLHVFFIVFYFFFFFFCCC